MISTNHCQKNSGRGKYEAVIGDDFIELADILEKLAVKHHVTQDEVEEVFFNHPRYRFVESD